MKQNGLTLDYKFVFSAISAGALVLGGIFWMANVANAANMAVDKTSKLESRLDTFEAKQDIFREEVLQRLTAVGIDVKWLVDNKTAPKTK